MGAPQIVRSPMDSAEACPTEAAGDEPCCDACHDDDDLIKVRLDGGRVALACCALARIIATPQPPVLTMPPP